LISGGDSRIEFYRPLSSVEFRIESFAPTPLSARFESDALTEPMVVDLVPGTNRVMVPLSAYPPAEQWEIRIISQTWNPLQALGAGQDKEMAFHLVGLEEYVVDDAGSPKSC
jgi:hypothetical protein